MALKGELLWFELSSTIYWVSILEIFAMTHMFWVWITHPSDLGGLWIHIFHGIRGPIGLWLIIKLPNTHDLFKNRVAQ